MDWRALVLIGSLLANGYLFNSIRKMDFNTREMTQSATRSRQNLAAVSTQLEQMSGTSVPALRDLVTEAELDGLIKKIAVAEASTLQADCGPKQIRNSGRVKALQTRFRTFLASYEEVAKKSADTGLKDPRKVQEIAAQLKADVLRECKR